MTQSISRNTQTNYFAETNSAMGSSLKSNSKAEAHQNNIDKGKSRFSSKLSKFFLLPSQGDQISKRSSINSNSSKRSQNSQNKSLEKSIKKETASYNNKRIVVLPSYLQDQEIRLKSQSSDYKPKVIANKHLIESFRKNEGSVQRTFTGNEKKG